MESEENSVDHVDDGNLLEPLSEVSFSEREKSFETTVTTAKVNAPKSTNTPTATVTATNTSISSTTKESDISLPDARAKVLHLQRVQRGGGSSGSDTAKSSSGTKKRNSKSHSRDKESNEKEEETVSLSLDSLIRRGVMNDTSKAANFKNSFKFGKPDDDISLRVNPSANLFYEHSNDAYSDSESDSYESSHGGDRDGSDEAKFGVSNGNITNGNGLTDEHVTIAKRKRGRPPLTEEEKSERAAQKEALRLQNRSIQSQVDDFSMAMGHSIFDASSPKKRGRPAKNRYVTFLNSTTHSEQDSQNESSQLDESATTSDFPPTKKKRGRKPKSYYLELAAQANESAASIDGGQNGTDVSDQPSPVPTTSANAPIEWKKRGRKPKFLENYFVKLEQQQQQQQSDDQQMGQVHQQSPNVSGQIVKKKRGRKPKSYYVQQMIEQANDSAPAILQSTSFDADDLQQDKQSEQMSANTSIDFSIYANKRGRKPKAYYEHLASLQQDSNPNTSIASQDSVPSGPNDSILSHEPPVKKKRGRKPKSYYWNLQAQQAAEDQSTSIPQSNITGDSVPSTSRLTTEYDRQVESSTTQSLLPTKPIPKSAIRTYIHRPYVRRIIPQQKIFRRPVRATTTTTANYY